MKMILKEWKELAEQRGIGKTWSGSKKNLEFIKVIQDIQRGKCWQFPSKHCPRERNSWPVDFSHSGPVGKALDFMLR